MPKKQPPGAMRIEYMDLDTLLAHPRNPKAHAVEVIDESMARFGFVAPPTIDEGTGQLAAGHGRLKTLVRRRAEHLAPPARIEVGSKGEWLVPVIRGIAFKNDAELVAYLVADNRTTEAGGWDEDKELQALQAALEDGGGSLRGTGFDEDDVEKMKKKAGGNIEVQEVSFDDVQDRFWMSVRGPMPKQAEALEVLKKQLEALPGVEVEIGTTEMDQ